MRQQVHWGRSHAQLHSLRELYRLAHQDAPERDGRRTRRGRRRPPDAARHSERWTPCWGRWRGVRPAVFLRPGCGMTIHDSDDVLRVNCGRCVKPLLRAVEDLGDRRTIDCDDCGKTLPVHEHYRPLCPVTYSARNLRRPASNVRRSTSRSRLISSLVAAIQDLPCGETIPANRLESCCDSVQVPPSGSPGSARVE